MCEANAYVYRNGHEELYLESVDVLVPEGNTIYLKSLFGEQKTFKGSVKEISLLRHRIVLEESE